MITSVCSLPFGNRVVSGSVGSTLRVWNVETGSCERVLKGHVEVLAPHLHFYSFRQNISLGSDKYLCIVRWPPGGVRIFRPDSPSVECGDRIL
jgi:WD40 repeat protein